MVLDHDFRAVVFAERFEQFKSVPTEPVSVGDNNLLDISSVDAFQKGLKVLSFVVESATGVLESLVVRITLLEFGDLSLEVTGLLGGADPRIDVALLFLVRFRGRSELSLNVSDVIDAFSRTSSITESSDPDSSRVPPAGKGGSGDFISPSDLRRGLVHPVLYERVSILTGIPHVLYIFAWLLNEGCGWVCGLSHTKINKIPLVWKRSGNVICRFSDIGFVKVCRRA